jgi:hypothetical protein
VADPEDDGNACRIHGFGSHRSEKPGGSPREVLFLTMERLVTRNQQDFAFPGLEVVNPWES